MLPPSTVLAVYGIITQQDIGKLFIAGIVPGTAGDRDAHDHHRASSAWRGRASCRRDRRRPGITGLLALRDVWSPLLLFVFVIGGLYGGVFYPDRGRRE